MQSSIPSPEGEMNVPASKLPTEKPRRKDFRDSFHWRIFRIMAEFVEGFQFLADFKKTVTIFGSARFNENSEWYGQARRLGKMLSDNGFVAVTGGGPGIMEAANRGATEGKNSRNSVGLNIQLPEEQRINPYVKKGIGFHYFFTRKVMLSYAARAYVFFPGGFGTLDEFFEITTLIQTKKIDEEIPVVLIGREFWEPFIKWIDEDVFQKHGTIDKEDMEIYKLVDTVDEVFSIIKASKERTDLYEE